MHPLSAVCTCSFNLRRYPPHQQVVSWALAVRGDSDRLQDVEVWGVSWRDEQLVAAWEGLWSIELVGVLFLRVWRVLCNEFLRTYVQCTDVMAVQETYTITDRLWNILMSLYCRVVPPFACNTACALLAVDSYNTLNKSPTRCYSMQSDLFHCKVTLHVSGVTVAVPILWPVPEAAVTVFSTPDDGCCDTRNM